MTVLKRLAAAGVAVFLAGCVSLLPETTPASIYRLSTPEPSGGSAMNRQVVRVDLPLAPRGIASDEIAISLQHGELAFIDGAKWISTTPRLVQDLVISAIDAYEPDLIASRPEDGVNAEYELHTEVRSFEAVYRDGPDAPPTAIVQMRVRMVRLSDRSLLGVQAVGAQARARTNTVGDIVAAFDAAAQETAGEISSWATQQARAHPPVVEED
jgi:cholesterol transport system auxiliary component